MTFKELIKQDNSELISYAEKLKSKLELNEFLLSKNIILKEDELNSIFKYLHPSENKPLDLDELDSVAGGKGDRIEKEQRIEKEDINGSYNKNKFTFT